MSKSKRLFFSFLAVLIVGLAACSQGTSNSDANVTSAPLVGDPAAGQGLYAQKCSTCHGSEGSGGRGRTLNPASATLRGADTAAFTQNLVQIITHGKGRMPAWGDTRRLTDQQIADIAAYILSLNE
jgi:mono/diheme cytochrome c family protein